MKKKLGERIDNILERLYDHAEVPYSLRDYIGKDVDAYIEDQVERYAKDYLDAYYENFENRDIKAIEKRTEKLQDEISQLKQAIDGLRSGTQIVN